MFSLPNCPTEISSLIHQADKISPSEMRGATQQSNIGIGSLGARGTQGLSGGAGVFGGLEGGQQLSEQSQGASMEQAPVGGSERFGALEAGAVGQEALGQAGLGGDAGMSQSPVSRMTEGLGGGAGESLQGIQGIQGMQSIQDIQRMQSMPSALAGGQGQVGMFSDGGGMSALQGQGLMRASLQGGLQSMLGGGGGLTGLQAMGGGGDLGQQQMAFKKVSGFEVSILTLQLTFAALNFKLFIIKSLFNTATLAKLFTQRVS